MNTVAVCASTGRVGSAVCKQLDALKVPWIGITRDAAAARKSAAAAGFVPTTGRWESANYSDAKYCAPIFAQCNRLFLATADDLQQFEQESQLIDLAKTSKLEHIVKLSAQSAGLSPPVSFGVQHNKTERVLKDSGVSYSILRPVFFMQSLLFFSGPIKSGTLPAPTKAGRVAFVDSDDVAQAAATILANPLPHQSKTYELTGPSNHSFGDIATLIG